MSEWIALHPAIASAIGGALLILWLLFSYNRELAKQLKACRANLADVMKSRQQASCSSPSPVNHDEHAKFRDAIAMLVLEKLMATPRDAPRSIADEAQLAYLYADGMLIASGRRASKSAVASALIHYD